MTADFLPFQQFYDRLRFLCDEVWIVGTLYRWAAIDWGDYNYRMSGTTFSPPSSRSG